MTDEWVMKMSYIHTMEYYSDIKKDIIVSFLATWVDLEIIILSKVNQAEKGKCHMISLYELKKSDTNELIYKTDRDRLREQTHGYKRGRVDGGGIVKEFGIDMYTLLYLKRITNKDLLCSTGNSIQYYITNGKII